MLHSLKETLPRPHGNRLAPTQFLHKAVVQGTKCLMMIFGEAFILLVFCAVQTAAPHGRRLQKNYLRLYEPSFNGLSYILLIPMFYWQPHDREFIVRPMAVLHGRKCLT